MQPTNLHVLNDLVSMSCKSPCPCSCFFLQCVQPCHHINVAIRFLVPSSVVPKQLLLDVVDELQTWKARFVKYVYAVLVSATCRLACVVVASYASSVSALSVFALCSISNDAFVSKGAGDGCEDVRCRQRVEFTFCLPKQSEGSSYFWDKYVHVPSLSLRILCCLQEVQSVVNSLLQSSGNSSLFLHFIN